MLKLRVMSIEEGKVMIRATLKNAPKCLKMLISGLWSLVDVDPKHAGSR